MKEILQKKQIQRYILFCVSFFVLGILFDHFVIYPYFRIGKVEHIKEVHKESETKEQEVLLLSSTEQDRKIEIEKVCKIHVDISGALKQPGVFCLEEGAMVIDAVSKAGGFTSNVAYRFVSRKLNLSQKLVDNQKIYIPFEDEMECTVLSFLPQTREVQNILSNSGKRSFPTSEEEQEASAPVIPNPQTDESGCVNINTATASQLETLSGVGPSMSQKIVDGRPYASIEDLKNVSGIGEALFKKIKGDVCI